MIGFSIELAMGKWWKYLAFLILGSIGGNIFSAVIDPYNLSVGASTALFALFACTLVWFYLNFHQLGPMKFQYLGFFAFMIFFSLINGLFMK
jgi:membrane associated rhomboid family serine protease